MNRLILFFVMFLGINITACDSDNCGKTTYRPEIGVGYVFMYDAEGNVLHPVAGATVIVDNLYWTPGMYGADLSVAKESYITDAEGRYQVNFIERKCHTFSNGKKEMIYCNTYTFDCKNKLFFGLNVADVKNNAQNNVLLLDTIKLK